MSRITIDDLNFLEVALPVSQVKGGAIAPSVSTSVTTSLKTRTITDLKIGGNYENGFTIDILGIGSGAAAGAAAGSVGGRSFSSAVAVVV